MEIIMAGSGQDRKSIVCGIRNYMIEIYLFVIFIIYPYYHRNGFVKMGYLKYRFFLISSVIMLAAAIVLAAVYGIAALRDREKPPLRLHAVSVSALDYAVLAYGAFAFLSYWRSDFRKAAWEGAQGWYMGMQMQLILILLYAVISRCRIETSRVTAYILIGSAIAFVFAVLHRFMIDPLHMYQGLKDWQILQFLSTLGQATWYSSFVCTVYPIGIAVFWHCTNPKYRIPAGIYSAIAFATIVTQNSDSAYISLAAVMLALFWFSFESNAKMKRFLEVTLLMLADFKIVGILQMLFADRAVRLDAVSVFLSQSTAAWIALLVTAAIYLLFCHLDKIHKIAIPKLRFVRTAVMAVCAAAAAAVILFIAVNTHRINTGQTDGFVTYHQYLYFDNSWGNGRGMTWRHTLDMWKDFSVGRKLIGVGPDAYSFYSYSIPEYADRLHAAWGSVTLTNSHNEWMNAFICYGLLGAVSYIGIFVTAIVRFARARESSPLAFAVMLCALSYMGHNLFCYQQVLCTPFLFILFGIGESMVRGTKSE